MNKYVMSIGIATTTLFSAYAHKTAPTPFAQLESVIVTNAHTAKDKFSDENLLVLLNFFALRAQDSRNAFEKCIQHFEENKDAAEVAQLFFINAVNVIQTYENAMVKKINRKTNLTEEQEEDILQKLHDKIEELFSYIHTVYYDVFYTKIATENPNMLKFMFDENGIIFEDKRTQALPTSL